MRVCAHHDGRYQGDREFNLHPTTTRQTKQAMRYVTLVGWRDAFGWSVLTRLVDWWRGG